jgi:hypothetical protein
LSLPASSGATLELLNYHPRAKSSGAAHVIKIYTSRENARPSLILDVFARQPRDGNRSGFSGLNNIAAESKTLDRTSTHEEPQAFERCLWRCIFVTQRREDNAFLVCRSRLPCIHCVCFPRVVSPLLLPNKRSPNSSAPRKFIIDRGVYTSETGQQNAHLPSSPHPFTLSILL